MFATSQRFCNPKPPNFTGSVSNALSTSEHILSPVIACKNVILMFLQSEVHSGIYQVVFVRKTRIFV